MPSSAMASPVNGRYNTVLPVVLFVFSNVAALDIKVWELFQNAFVFGRFVTGIIGVEKNKLILPAFNLNIINTRTM